MRGRFGTEECRFRGRWSGPLHRGAKRSLPGGASRILPFYPFRSVLRFYNFTVVRRFCSFSLFAPWCVFTILLFFAVLLFYFFRAVVCFYNFTFFRFYMFPSRGGGTSDPAVFYILTVLHFLPHEVGCLVFTFLHFYPFTRLRRPKIYFSIFRFYGFRCCCASGLLNCFTNTKPAQHAIVTIKSRAD